MKSDELLAQAQAAYRRGDCSYRDALLETGRLLHQFVLSRLEEGDSLSKYKRMNLGIIRSKIMDEAAFRLEITHVRVRELIGAAVVVELLSEKMDLGTLGHGAIRYFWPFIKRCSGVKGRELGTPGNPISQSERFVIRPGYEEIAKSMFRRAVAEKWRQDQVLEAAKRAFAGSSDPRHERYAPNRPPILSVNREAEEELDREGDLDWKDREFRKQRDSHKGRQRQAAVAAPGDVAEMCMDLVREAQDPRAVALCLQGKLAELLAKKRRIG